MSTIFALSSGTLPSAIAIFRVSGPQSLPVLRQLSRRKKWAPKVMEFTKLYDHTGIIDEAMAVYFPGIFFYVFLSLFSKLNVFSGPKTFTGEDTAELFVHGSQAVATKLATTLATFENVREARRGEFTRRAFHNGKINLSEVRGLDRLIKSRTEKERTAAFSQMRGGIRAIEIRKKLVAVLAKLFVIIDFGEHVEIQQEEAQHDVTEVLLELHRMIRAWKGAELAQRGLDVVLYGRPNSGKSSILNQLAHDDVAIVSPIAGTTRDSLVTHVQIGGVRCRLTDTAGIRSTADDVIEAEGMRRARRRLEAADIVIVVMDPESETEEVDRILEDVKSTKSSEAKVILVRNKADLGLPYPSIPTYPTVSTSATSTEGIDPLRSLLTELVEELCPEANYLLDGSLLQKCADELTCAVLSRDAAIMCQHVETAVEHIAELTEGVVSETVLDDIFSKFCIGK